jgi:hypothetical protein
MKLDDETLGYIQTVVNTAVLIGIDNIIIEAGMVRAIDENKTVVIFQDENVPTPLFGAIGLNRINVFTSRFDIIKNRDDASIEVTVDDGRVFARSLIMRSKGIKVDYRCANPATIQAPRQINDTMKYRVPLTAEAVMLLQKGQSAMGADTVSIISNDNGVSFELADINNDVFSHVFTQNVESLDNGKTTFAHRYPVKTLLSMFKSNAEGDFYVGGKGMLKFMVNGLDVYVIPQV